MTEQHPNVTGFVGQYSASMSKEQAASFWKKFRKAANAYAQTQANKITELEKQNNCYKTALQVIHTWASFQKGQELVPKHVVNLTERAMNIKNSNQ